MENKGMKTQIDRLYEVAYSQSGLTKPADIARAMNISQQTLKNWESRGISKEGLIAAEGAFGCTAVWLETGEGEKLVTQTKHQTTRIPSKQNPEDSNISEATHPEHIQAVIELMYSVDERGMRKIRDAAEDAIDRYRALQKELGVEIKPTPKKTIKPTETAQSNVATQHHFEGSQQNFNTGSIGGVTGRGNIVNQYSRNK